ncbi:protein FAM102B-like isoform X2 [Gigantopelta aegis]|uniref:protein FAM102B-like isoform X2 n=1 Tax=Gigantopelta aegis TaxID=1735272 RepID=UPI001B88BDC2|nr:protein FAM102B-like isoform X2 [Gigantopelta aegis]
MMSFMSKKKKYRFQVQLELEELSSVPFVSGVLFAKIKLRDGGSYLEHSTREEVSNNRVRWNAKFSFPCKMTASAITGVLENCICRISVRKEVRGGHSYQRLGFADIDLAEFAGSGQQCRRYLLEGYDTKHRQDNSTLKVLIEVSLISGDPVFKVPSQLTVSSEKVTLTVAETPIHDGCSECSLASNSSGFGSLPRKDKMPIPAKEPLDTEQQEKEFEKSHSRNSSYASELSRGSGYHSRQSSVGDPSCSHTRTPSLGSSLGDHSKSDRRRKIDESVKDRRVGETRVNAEDLVEELIKDTDLGLDDSQEENQCYCQRWKQSHSIKYKSKFVKKPC